MHGIMTCAPHVRPPARSASGCAGGALALSDVRARASFSPPAGMMGLGSGRVVGG
jgi:hypothetical protein